MKNVCVNFLSHHTICWGINLNDLVGKIMQEITSSLDQLQNWGISESESNLLAHRSAVSKWKKYLFAFGSELQDELLLNV